MTDMEMLKEEILGLLKAEVKDLWKKEDEEFLKQLAVDIAREKELSVTSDNPAEHERNLLHLAATLQGEVSRKKLELNEKGKDLFVRVLTTVVKTVALPALGIV